MKYQLALLLLLLCLFNSKINSFRSKNFKFGSNQSVNRHKSRQPMANPNYSPALNFSNTTNLFVQLDSCVLYYNAALFCKFNYPNMQIPDLQNCVGNMTQTLQQNNCMPCFSNFFGRIQNKMRILGSLTSDYVDPNPSVNDLISDAKKSIFRKLLFTTKHCATTPMNLRSAYEIFVRDYDNEDWQTQIDYFFSSYDDAKDDGVFPSCPKVNVYANLIYALLNKEDFSPPLFYSSVDGKSYKKSSLKQTKNKKKKPRNFKHTDEVEEEQEDEEEIKDKKSVSHKHKRNFRMNSEAELGNYIDNKDYQELDDQEETEMLGFPEEKPEVNEKIDVEANDEQDSEEENVQPRKKKAHEEQEEIETNEEDNIPEKKTKTVKKVKKIKPKQEKKKNKKASEENEDSEETDNDNVNEKDDEVNDNEDAEE